MITFQLLTSMLQTKEDTKTTTEKSKAAVSAKAEPVSEAVGDSHGFFLPSGTALQGLGVIKTELSLVDSDLVPGPPSSGGGHTILHRVTLASLDQNEQC